MLWSSPGASTGGAGDTDHTTPISEEPPCREGVHLDLEAPPLSLVVWEQNYPKKTKGKMNNLP